MDRVSVDGKQFAHNGGRFLFRGVTYGTFAPRSDGFRYPETDAVKRDFADMVEAGFTVVRTYTAPHDDVVESRLRMGTAAVRRRLLPGLALPLRTRPQRAA